MSRATLQPHPAPDMPTSVDVLIIGAGLGGTVAAAICAQAGVRTLLVDRATFPRDKVCGGCLAQRGVNALHDLGLTDAHWQRTTTPLTTVTVHHGTARLDLPLRPGRVVDRAVLDAQLVAEVQRRGGRFVAGHRAIIDTIQTDAVNVQIGPHRVQAKAVLVADGLGGRALSRLPGFEVTTAPASHLGLATTLDVTPEAHAAWPPAEHLDMNTTRAGYVGVVRLADGRAHLAAACRPHHLKAAGSPHAALSQLLPAGPLRHQITPDVPLLITPRLTRHRRKLADHRVLVLGDAAGYVEPFTGEGMSWAITAAQAATHLALPHLNHWPATLAHQWAARYHQDIGKSQRTCRALAALLRRPLLTTAAVRILAACPAAARPLTRRLAA